ncbi:MAG TPA: Amuc_1100 family pilus-like protein [Verrucomicrobiota bacterium]|nr:Amuc_1100 family pilus-like protein [Verrucomicrobiota bacterium]
MPWIQKNLILVLGGVVGLALLAAAGWFWFNQAQREQEIGAQLEAKNAEWTDLVGRKPYPSDDNIRAVRDEEKRLEKLREVLKQNFPAVAAAPVSDALELKVLIETAIAELRAEAEAAGVTLPDRDYSFTFQRLRPMAPSQFDSNSIPTLAEQVAQVGALARVLFDARVHSLEAIRRPAILKEEGGASDYLTLKPVSDDLVTRMPMEVTFRSFSGELAGVVAGLAALPNTVVIKKISVEPTTLSGPASGPQPMMPFRPPPPQAEAAPPQGDRYGGLRRGGPGGMSPDLASRYGLGPGGGRPTPGPGGMDPALAQRYGLTPPAGAAPPMAPAAPSSPGSPAAVVDERPLRVTFHLEFVKLKPAPAAPGRRAI